MSAPATPPLDKRQVGRAFARAASSYDGCAVLQREMGRRLLERLELVRLQPATVLDLGCGTGADLPALRQRYPKARLYGLDLALDMLQHSRRRGAGELRWWRRPGLLCGDLEALPLADAGIDLLYSNAALQWSNDLPGALAEARRVLRAGGLAMFTTFGPDTLRELRWAWSQVDSHAHVSPFIDMHDIGDALLRAGFADPVMDMEHITLTYDSVNALMRDLKGLGAGNATQGRSRGLTGKGRMQAMRQAYERLRDAGRLPATYEVVYGHAWVPEGPPPRRADAAGVVQVPLAALGGRRGTAAD